MDALLLGVVQERGRVGESGTSSTPTRPSRSGTSSWCRPTACRAGRGWLGRPGSGCSRSRRCCRRSSARTTLRTCTRGAGAKRPSAGSGPRAPACSRVRTRTGSRPGRRRRRPAAPPSHSLTASTPRSGCRPAGGTRPGRGFPGASRGARPCTRQRWGSLPGSCSRARRWRCRTRGCTRRDSACRAASARLRRPARPTACRR